MYVTDGWWDEGQGSGNRKGGRRDGTGIKGGGISEVNGNRITDGEI